MVSSVSGSASALQGQIQRDKLDLNDWLGCVSAKTSTGQEEIRKYSGEISSAKETLARISASASQSPAASAVAASATATSATHLHQTGQPGTLIDAWA